MYRYLAKSDFLSQTDSTDKDIVGFYLYWGFI